MQANLTQNAPNPKYIIPHFLIGSFIWLLVIILLAIDPQLLQQHYFNNKLLALTHLFVLGFISIIIFGALHQLIPVIFKSNLYNEKFIPWSLALLFFGSLIMFISFLFFFELQILLLVGGFLVLISALMLITQIWLTSIKSKEKSIDKWFIKISCLWFLITALIGLSIAYNFVNPYLSKSHLDLLKIHAHIGLYGWFFQLIIGVSANLLPMFLLTHNLKKTFLNISFYLINIALIGGYISYFYENKITTLSFILIGLSGIVSFLIYIFQVYKNRIKKNLDFGMKLTMFAFILLLFPLIIYLIISLFNVKEIHFSISYIISLTIGFITTLVIGQTFKTFPFIVWLKEYKDVVGKEKTLLPKNLYSEKVLHIILYSHNIGFCLLLMGLLFEINILVQIGLYMLVFTAILYLFNVSKIAFHKRKKYE